MGFGVIGVITPEDLKMKIALSASFFNCPPVAALLHTCDIVYTTNDYALSNFAHRDIRAIKLWNGSRTEENQGEKFEFMKLDPVIVDFPDLFRIFNAWVHDVATDEELVEWADYFQENNPAEMRKKTAPLERLRKIE